MGKVDDLPNTEKFKKLKEENAILRMLKNANNRITDSLLNLQPVQNIIREISKFVECEENQKHEQQTAKLLADFNYKLTRLRGEDEKLNAEMSLLREQNKEINR